MERLLLTYCNTISSLAVKHMARLGRPPKHDAAKKSAHLSVRISARLREQLEAARRTAEPERSLSQEIELRLRQSFELDAEIKKRFGGNGTYWVLWLMANAIRHIEHTSGIAITAERHWFDDPFVFDQVVVAIETIFRYLRPAGRAVAPRGLLAIDAKKLGRQSALLVLANLELARGPPDNQRVGAAYHDAALPLGRRLRGSPVSEIERDWGRQLKRRGHR